MRLKSVIDTAPGAAMPADCETLLFQAQKIRDLTRALKALEPAKDHLTMPPVYLGEGQDKDAPASGQKSNAQSIATDFGLRIGDSRDPARILLDLDESGARYHIEGHPELGPVPVLASPSTSPQERKRAFATWPGAGGEIQHSIRFGRSSAEVDSRSARQPGPPPSTSCERRGAPDSVSDAELCFDSAFGLFESTDPRPGPPRSSVIGSGVFLPGGIALTAHHVYRAAILGANKRQPLYALLETGPASLLSTVPLSETRPTAPRKPPFDTEDTAVDLQPLLLAEAADTPASHKLLSASLAGRLISEDGTGPLLVNISYGEGYLESNRTGDGGVKRIGFGRYLPCGDASCPVLRDFRFDFPDGYPTNTTHNASCPEDSGSPIYATLTNGQRVIVGLLVAIRAQTLSLEGVCGSEALVVDLTNRELQTWLAGEIARVQCVDEAAEQTCLDAARARIKASIIAEGVELDRENTALDTQFAGR